MRIHTPRDKVIEVLLASDLGDYAVAGGRVRARCPVHGGDHQKSLSIDPTSGWGCCFNAACHATVLIRDFNPDVADRLMRSASQPPGPPHSPRPPHLPSPPRPSSQVATTWQQQECAMLLQHHDRFARMLLSYELADCWQAQAYLETRAIPLEVAQQEQVAYVPATLPQNEQMLPLGRWHDRLLFPLTSPTGRGFAGRSLWRWQIGMDEVTHKDLLDAEPEAPARWLKTNPAGWFCAPPVGFEDRVILVEGPFDRLALLAAGFGAQEVVALVGTSLHLDWLPDQVRHVVLALDGDEAGLGAMWRLVEPLSQDDREVHLCPPPDDGCGKDWSERWRRAGPDGLTDLYNTFDRIPETPSPSCHEKG